MNQKQLWMLVGGNGAGKTSFYQQRLKPLGLPFINADNIAKEIFPEAPEQNSYAAAQIAERMRLEQLASGKSLCFETVFSHPSKIDFIAQAKAMGYQIILVFIHLDNPALNNARIAQRLEQGGHFVPADKVEARIPRTLDNVKAAIPLCDQVWVLDNSRMDLPYRQLLTIKQGIVSKQAAALPAWAAQLLT
ncbi:MAG: AAA family ATPase [Cellvibrionaceae bacterium]|nr:AAA family ATPase [Cellvibrionaceae bacterium]